MSPRYLACVVLLSCAAVVAGGCSRDQLPVEVSGIVTFDGEPIPEGIVVDHEGRLASATAQPSMA